MHINQTKPCSVPLFTDLHSKDLTIYNFNNRRSGVGSKQRLHRSLLYFYCYCLYCQAEFLLCTCASMHATESTSSSGDILLPQGSPKVTVHVNLESPNLERILRGVGQGLSSKMETAKLGTLLPLCTWKHLHICEGNSTCRP